MPIRFYTPVVCSEFDYFSDIFLKLACRSLHIYIRFIWKRSSFSTFNKNFPQCPSLICVKWFLLIFPRSLFTPIDLKNCFRILVVPVFHLFVYISSTTLLNWNFLICHLGDRVPVPERWVFLRSSLIRFDTILPWVIISLNLHYFVSLYIIFISSP